VIVMLSTFLATSAVFVLLLGLAIRRIIRHLQGDPEAVQAVTAHVLVPLLGRKKPDAEKQRPMPRDSRLC
jgi:hypothetical protein